MTWWAWTLLWLVLVLAAAGFLFLMGRRLLRKGLALARELSEAAEVLAQVSERLEEQAAASSPGPSGPGHRSATRGSAPGRAGPPGSEDVP